MNPHARSLDTPNRLRRLCRPALLAMIAALVILAGPIAPAAADTENPHVWEPKTTSVAVFKNGLGFFLREGDVQLRDGWCVSGEIPPAAFGTLAT